MFTWICPKCGREVPPAYSECPTCLERQQAAAAPTAPAPVYAAPVQPGVAAPPPPPVYAQPAVAPPPPPPPSYSAPPAYAPAPVPAPVPQPQPAYLPAPPLPKRGIPSWLVAIGVAVVLAGAFWLLYKFVLTNNRTPASAPPAAVPAEVQATTASGKPHPYARSLEVTGIRIFEEKNKVQVRFVVVNHSTADMAGLAVRGSLSASAAKPDDPPITTFEAQIGNLGANESKDVAAPAATRLRAYELPDWQFLNAHIEITSPR
jgi:hypothetical protein